MKKQKKISFLLAMVLLLTAIGSPADSSVFAADNLTEPEMVLQNEAKSPDAMETPDDEKKEQPKSTVDKTFKDAEEKNGGKQNFDTENPDKYAAESATKNTKPTDSKSSENSKEEKDNSENLASQSDTENQVSTFTWEDKIDANTIAIDAPNGALPEGTQVKVNLVATSEILTALQKTTDDERLVADDVLAYNFVFTDANGNKIEPQKEITISIKVSEFNKIADVLAFHLKDIDSEPENVDVYFDDKTGTITLSSTVFSIYAIVLKAEPEEEVAIYLDGQKGNDEANGKSPETAVKTFVKAKELAKADQNINTIYIMGMVSITGDISLSGTNAVVKRYPSYGGYLMQVSGSDRTTFSDITIDGNSSNANDTKYSLVYCNGGTLTIGNGTVLKSNVLTDLSFFKALGGGVCVDHQGVLNMTGGTVSGNSAQYGGGVILLDHSTMNFSGGSVENNTAVDGSDSQFYRAVGGGIAVWNGSTLNMSDNALVDNNTSENLGGGISLGGGFSDGSHTLATTLNMTGGTVSNNTTKQCGGGIYVEAGEEKYHSSATANISGGNILYNKATADVTEGYAQFCGGGIYVNGTNQVGFENGVLNLTNAVIKDNSAQISGGGYASCPSSDTHIYVKNGVAIYGNKAIFAKDLYIESKGIYGDHNGDPEYAISPTMLGGTPYIWKNDNDMEVSLNKLNGKLSSALQEKIEFHTDVKSDVTAEKLAQVVISGNTSGFYGGGIASNGTVNMGESEVIDLSVTKVWMDENMEHPKHPKSIDVELYRTIPGSDKEPVYIGYETITPDEDENWGLTFHNLPKNDADGNSYLYTVKERKVEGYFPEVTGTMEKGYTIKNSTSPQINIEVRKVWDDAQNQDGVRPNQVVIQLLADGKPVEGKTLTLNADNEWTATFDNLDEYASGKKIAYTIAEGSVSDDYSCEISGTATEGFTVTNTHEPEKVTVSGSKTWDDANNQDGKRPDTITIQLLADNAVIQTKEVTAKEDWSWTFEDLPKYEDGKEIHYTVSEVAVPEYTSTVDGFDVTNSYTPGKTQVAVRKVWDDAQNQDGVRPNQVVIQLLADGKPVEGKTLTLNADNEWTATFDNLDEYASGKKVAYTIAEGSASEDYSCEISGTATEGFTVTNTHEPEEVTVSGSKTWNDNNDKAGKRRAQITINLFADGVRIAKKTVSGQDSWSWKFEELPKFKNGKAIQYTITEDPIPGYTSKIDGFNVTNTYTEVPPTPKEPNPPTPEKPKEPNPPTPEKPKKPENPKPSVPGTETPSSPEKKGHSPNTGDNAAPVVSVVLLLVAVVAFVLIEKKKERS